MDKKPSPPRQPRVMFDPTTRTITASPYELGRALVHVTQAVFAVSGLVIGAFAWFDVDTHRLVLAIFLLVIAGGFQEGDRA